MSDLKKPLYALTVEEFIELTEKTVRQAIEAEKVKQLGETSGPVDNCMTIRQCADFLNCSLVSIHNYKKQGLPYYRVGRKVLFKTSEVLNFMKRSKTQK
jgi:excisionase family DNA binding protein